MWLQDMVIVGLILRHLKVDGAKLTTAAVLFGALCFYLLGGTCPLPVSGSGALCFWLLQQGHAHIA